MAKKDEPCKLTIKMDNGDVHVLKLKSEPVLTYGWVMLTLLYGKQIAFSSAHIISMEKEELT